MPTTPEETRAPMPAGLRVPPAPIHARPGADTPPQGEWVTARGTRFVEVLMRLFTLPKLVWSYKDLLRTSVRRDLEIRFQGTLLGWLWPLVQPIFLFTVYYFIFTKLLAFKFPELPPEQESAMGIFMFVGVMAWAMLSDSLNRGTSVIVDSGNLIKKLAFPSEVLPLNVTLVGIVTMLFALVGVVVGTWRDAD